jgi:hypothetical protein
VTGGMTRTMDAKEDMGSKRRMAPRVVGDGLQQCSNNAFKKEIDIRRCQQCW